MAFRKSRRANNKRKSRKLRKRYRGGVGNIICPCCGRKTFYGDEEGASQYGVDTFRECSYCTFTSNMNQADCTRLKSQSRVI